MDNYHVYDVIGRGKYSTVHKGKKEGSVIKNFALKSVDKSHESTVAQEARILQNLDHSNVVKFYEGHETSTHLWLILEYCGGGDLRTLLEQEGKLAEDEVRDLARDLVEDIYTRRESSTVIKHLIGWKCCVILGYLEK